MMISTADIAAIKIFHSSGELKMLPPDEEPEEEEEPEAEEEQQAEESDV